MHTYWEKLKQTIKKRFPFLEKLYIYIRNIPVLLSLSPKKRALQRRLSRIYRQHTRKIRIGFFVSENEKWASQTLFDKLKNHPYFEPFLLLSSIEGLPPETAQEKFEKNRSFFRQVCGEIVEVYNPQTNTYLPLEPYHLDIIFYQQPWGIPEIQTPKHMFRFALLCYIPYGFDVSKKMLRILFYPFHQFLFRDYVNHPLIRQDYIRAGLKPEGIKSVGYPKLEPYLKQITTHEKPYVIYAPHHAIEPDSIRLGTFTWNGRFMLEYAKNHPQFNWVFKPHPRCKISFLKEGLFKNRQELEHYYQQWAEVGTVYEGGNYIKLFQQTRCLITDCASFLVEFLPTEQPVIHLKRTDENAQHSMTPNIAKAYYPCFDLPTLKNTLHTVLEEGKDPMRPARLAKIAEMDLVQPATDNIIRDLEEALSAP